MSELADTITEAAEKSRESRLNSLVAISVAIVATFTALCNVKDGNIVQAMQQAQAKSVDAWAYYQAKGTKENIAESVLDNLKIQRDLAPPATPQARAELDRKLGEYEEKVRHYAQEKSDVKREAEGFEHEYDRLNTHDDQFDMSEALSSVAIALLGVTALTGKRRLLIVAWSFAGVGVILGLAGFLGLSLHPDFLARILG